MDASGLNYSDLLKPYWMLQLLIGGAVFLAICFVILKGRSDNKKDAHLAGPGHESMSAGMTVVSHQILQYLASIAENVRGTREAVSSVQNEQIKTNARLAELQDVHKDQMEQLRDQIAASMAPPPRR